MTKFLTELVKSPAWLLLVLLGLLAFIWAALPTSAVIVGVTIGLDGSWRYGVAVLGVMLVLVGILFGLITVGLVGRHAEGTAERLPVEKIEISGDVRRTNPPPHARYSLSGQVTPAKPGVTVWLIRQSLVAQAVDYSPSPHPATTDNNGRWEQSINMWPGTFRIHAVVTTAENGSLYRWYGRARGAALAIVRERDPDTNTIPFWPSLDHLSEPYVSDSCHVDV